MKLNVECLSTGVRSRLFTFEIKLFPNKWFLFLLFLVQVNYFWGHYKALCPLCIKHMNFDCCDYGIEFRDKSMYCSVPALGNSNQHLISCKDGTRSKSRTEKNISGLLGPSLLQSTNPILLLLWVLKTSDLFSLFLNIFKQVSRILFISAIKLNIQLSKLLILLKC